MAWGTPLFQYRSTSLNAYRTQGKAAGTGMFGTGGSAPVLVNSGLPTNTFGSGYLDLNSTTIRAQVFNLGGGNYPSGAITLLLRFAPTFSGSPTGAQGLFSIGGESSFPSGMTVTINTSGKIVITIRNNTAANVLSYTSTATFNPTANNWYDLFIASDGTTTAGATTIAMYDNAGTNIFSETATLAVGGRSGTLFTPDIAAALYLGAPVANIPKFWVNEFCIFNTKETYQTRSDFITASAFEGYSYTDPGVAAVKTGTAYTYAGVSQTGTYDGSDRWTDPGVGNVLSGVQYKANSLTNNMTGTAAIPTAAQNASAVWEELLSGHTDATKFGGFVQKLLTVAKFLGLK